MIFIAPEPDKSIWLYIDYDLLIESIDYSNKDVTYAKFIINEFPELMEIIQSNYCKYRKKIYYLNKELVIPKIMKKPIKINKEIKLPIFKNKLI